MRFPAPHFECLSEIEPPARISPLVRPSVWVSAPEPLPADPRRSAAPNGGSTMRFAAGAAAALLCLLQSARGVDRSKFRTCAQTGFCKRHRDAVENAAGARHAVLENTVVLKDGLFEAQIAVPGGTDAPLLVEARVFAPGVARLRINEVPAQRWETTEVVLPRTAPSAGAPRAAGSRFEMGLGDGAELVVESAPFRVSLRRDGAEHIVFNGRGLLHFEQRSDASEASAGSDSATSEEDRHGGKKVVDYGEDGLAIYEDGTKEEKREAVHHASAESHTESFGGHTDPNALGPQSVGADIFFPLASHVYGIPEHATSLSLKSTRGRGAAYDEPYRLYTLDVFEYELDNPMALYGAIPYLQAHGARGSSGVFWNNPSETFVDIEDVRGGKQSRWLSETGLVDLFLLSGGTPKQLARQYSMVTGTPALPPAFALGFHQCRWNYKDERDVMQVLDGFESHDFPVDVIWLDIEHTDGKRYFTWDAALFPDPLRMQKALEDKGRRMVTIVDPHIKRDDGFAVHKEATERGFYVKKADGEGDFDGWCWSGSSSYLDFTSAEVRAWWASRFALDKYVGSSLSLFTWNDMNEPSVFNGPEVSMAKDLKSIGGVEHREWHNVYGMFMHSATADGLTMRSPKQDQRPFVLSRAFYAGSQRYGAIWTGDNTASWAHLAAAAPMLLSISLSGLSFCGADVGGFFGNPDAELMTRWMQAAAYQPFFRNHAHHDSKRREPWLFGEEPLQRMRAAALERYALLPYLYTAFAEAWMTGAPVMRPLFVEFPQDESAFAVDDAWMLGGALLVKPVTAAGKTSADVYFPGNGVWYDARSLEAVRAAKGPKQLTVPAPLDAIPVFQRGGSVVPRRMRLRRSAMLMRSDPITLFVALDEDGTAAGMLYADDEETNAFRDDHAFALRSFAFKDGTLTCAEATSRRGAAGGVNPSEDLELIGGGAAVARDVEVERIVIMGVKAAPKGAAVGRRAVDVEYRQQAGIAVLRKPGVSVLQDWSLDVRF